MPVSAENPGVVVPPGRRASTVTPLDSRLTPNIIAKVRFRPEPGSRRRTATKPAQDEPIWESSKLFKTLYNCFTIENDTAMPRFGRGVYALW